MQGGSNQPLQIQHVRRALLQNYSGLIFDQDLQGYDDAGREQRFLSRALAAEAVRMVTGCDFAAAGAAVIDGDLDQGIDAIAVGESLRDIWLVQAKWSDAGKAKLPKAEALAFVDGVRLISNRDFAPFNDRISKTTALLDAALGDPALRIHLVVAVMGPSVLPDASKAVLNRLADDANANGPQLYQYVLGAADFHARLREDVAPSPVSISVWMNDWIRRDSPYDAWQGTVPVKNVSEWFDKHADKLFEQNVRNSLGRTRINSGIKETLRTEPENFWYFNNGITIVCDEIRPRYPQRRVPNEPVELALDGVSVVNGAQTVTSIHDAMGEFPEIAEGADVTVRVFSLGGLGSTYGKRVTETTNTQNDVSARDFIALDPVQAEIREDMLLSLGKSYTYKRGAPDPAPETGCSIVQVAVALACAHHSAELAVRAARDTNLLWERSSRGAYSRIFGEAPSAYRIWRSVELHRAVGEALADERAKLNGRAADVTRRGELLISHLVFQQVEQDEFDDPSCDWQSVLERVPAWTAECAAWLIHHIDAVYGRNSFLSSTFIDETRCRQLAKLVLQDVAAGRVIPDLPDDYRPPVKPDRRTRRPNSVTLLVNAGAIDDGIPLTFHTETEPERQAITAWLAEDPRRSKATWVNDRLKCLLWAYDGKQYSATGLVQTIWAQAPYEDSPVAVQGTRRWKLASGESLAELASGLYAAEAEAE